MNNYVVRTVELKRDFGQTRALDKLDLEIPPGSICLLLGPNGAGKTTLLRILMGLIAPTAGTASVLGRPSWHPPADNLSAVGYVGDRCEPPGWATMELLEDLQAGASKLFDKVLFRQMCRGRDLRLDQSYNALSKGQRRWVLVSLALAARPKLVLLDKPTDGLDPAAQCALYDALRDHVNQYEATAIVATHVIADVERIGDEVIILDRGRLFLHAPLETLRDDVRQVEIEQGDGPPGFGSLDFGPQTAILGRTKRETTEIVLIKQEGLSDEELCHRFGPKVVIRRVGLEEMYMAVAGGQSAPLGLTTEEVAS